MGRRMGLSGELRAYQAVYGFYEGLAPVTSKPTT
jgi:hypothetical protein